MSELISQDHPDRLMYERAWHAVRTIRALAAVPGLDSTGGFDAAAKLIVDEMKWAALSQANAERERSPSSSIKGDK